MQSARAYTLSVLLYLISALAAAQHAPRTYKITDLGTLGGDISFPSDLNALGQVAGISNPRGSREFHAFFWTARGPMQDLGTLGGTTSIANGLNNIGQVVGNAYVRGGATFHAFLWTHATGMQDLGTLGGAVSNAFSINDLGQVVGSSSTGVPGVVHAFLRTKSAGFQDLGILGGNYSSACSINRLGRVIGSSTISGAVTQPAFVWTQEEGMQNFGTLGVTSIPVRINKRGEFVGYYSGTSLAARAFIWTAATGNLDMGTLGGNGSAAFGINDYTQVVGSSRLADNVTQHAFLWTEASGMTDLNSYLPPNSRWILQGAEAINNSGQIVGWGVKDWKLQHAFILSPESVPENALALTRSKLCSTCYEPGTH